MKALIQTEDLYEDEEFVLVKAAYSNSTEEISVCFKNKNGDISKIITVAEKQI